MNNIKVKPQSSKSICSKAHLLREVCSKLYDNSEKFPIVEFIEKVVQKIDKELYFGVLPKYEMGNNHGLTDPVKKTIFIREDVYENALKGNGRDRFTIAHELAHYLMHSKQDIVFTRNDEKLKPYEDSEWQANVFASELLMPDYLITEEDTVFTLMNRFGVTRSAAKVRLNKLKN